MARQGPKRARRRLLTVIGTALSGTVVVIAAAVTPAQAAGVQQCRDQTTTIRNLPGSGQTQVWLDVCVSSDGGNGRNAFVRNIYWVTKATSYNLYYYFRIQIRLERNDADYSVHKCDLTWEANYLRRPDGNTPSICSAGKISTGLRGGWTGDGYLEYDIVGDGEGRKTWQFTGSPQIN
jgi:hypothetical protein